MIRSFFLLSILGFVLALVSCERSTNKYAYTKPPTNFTELQNGFNKAELNPDINHIDDTTITIVATGHIYPLLNHPLAFESFVATIKAQNPDYVFILGDMVYNNTQKEWDLFFNYFAALKDKLYFSPGNHDLNYHYERYNGIRDHQFETEQRYISNVGYRYKTLKDNMANYVFINMNDSIDRVLAYLSYIESELDKSKPSLLLSSQCIWHKKQQNPDDPKTWTNKPFRREELLPQITHFDYLIHGDWGGKFYRYYWPKEKGKFHVMGVGNKKAGDSLYISRLEIFHDTIISYSIPVPVPDESKWYKKRDNNLNNIVSKL